MGVKQSGLSEITARALKDINLIERSREAAKEFLREDPNIKKYPELGQRIARVSANLHLS